MIQGDDDRKAGWDDQHDQPLETQRLDLDDDNQLPWLESADEDDYDYEGGHGRLIVLGLIGLVVIAALAAAAWWMMRGDAGGEVVADGSTIEAPKTPYKEAPKDPGGKTFAGTGDTSFAVSEGQTRPAKLDSSAAAAPTPAPSVASPSAAAPAPAASAAPKPPASKPAPSGVGVQIGAYGSQAAADAAWSRLSAQYEALKGVPHRVQQGKADIGTVYRLQAVPGDAAAASALCSRLKAAGLACQVKQ